MANLFACRSERVSAFAMPARNRLLALGLAVEGLALAAVLWLPPLQSVFETAPLPAWAWPAILLGPVALLAVDEGAKWIGRRRAMRHQQAAVPG